MFTSPLSAPSARSTLPPAGSRGCVSSKRSEATVDGHENAMRDGFTRAGKPCGVFSSVLSPLKSEEKSPMPAPRRGLVCLVTRIRAVPSLEGTTLATASMDTFGSNPAGETVNVAVDIHAPMRVPREALQRQ